MSLHLWVITLYEVTHRWVISLHVSPDDSLHTSVLVSLSQLIWVLEGGAEVIVRVQKFICLLSRWVIA